MIPSEIRFSDLHFISSPQDFDAKGAEDIFRGIHRTVQVDRDFSRTIASDFRCAIAVLVTSLELSTEKTTSIPSTQLNRRRRRRVRDRITNYVGCGEAFKRDVVISRIRPRRVL